MENIITLTESEIEALIIENPTLLEDGLKIIDNQVQTEVGILDILAKDSDGKYVIIELKRDRSSDEVIGQISRYMGIVMEEYNLSKNDIRGIIFCKSTSKRLRSSLKLFDNIEVITFKQVWPNENFPPSDGFVRKLQERTYFNYIKDKETGKRTKKIPNITYTLTIPVEIVKKMGWKKFNEINVSINNDGVVILEKGY